MTTQPVDSQFALQSSQYNDVVQRKMSMDAMRKRLGDGRTEEQKLRESCEGFESLFIQKMWEQMRKTLPKEGYLHSKDEETYQSMFDVELSKKMASSGGMGLADMLYEQLSQKLTSAARTTIPNTSINPQAGVTQANMAQNNLSASATNTTTANSSAKELTVANLYTPLENGGVTNSSVDEEEVSVAEPVLPLVAQAMLDLQDVLKTSLPSNEPEQNILHNPLPVKGTGQESQANLNANAQQNSLNTKTEKNPLNANDNAKPLGEQSVSATNLQGQSWLGGAKVSAKPKPVPDGARFSKSLIEKNQDEMAESGAAAQAPALTKTEDTPALAPELAPKVKSVQALPVEGKVVQNFGWQKTAKGQEWHEAMLIGARVGQDVQAPLDGKVLFIGQKEGLGSTVILEHAKGYQSTYGNVEAQNLEVGNEVQAGTNFAKVLAGSPMPEQGEDFALMHLLMKRGEMPLDPANTIKRISSANR